MTDTVALPPVSLRRLFLKLGGWWVIVLGLQLVMLTAGSSITLSLAERFDAEGRPARAEVMDQHVTSSTDSDGNRSTTYWLSLEYETRTGETIAKDTSVRYGIYQDVQVGDTVDILYLESAPNTIEVEAGSNRETAGVIQVIALVLGIAWLVLLWIVGRWSVAAVRARRYGRREIAVVERIMTTNVRVFGRRRLRIVWRDKAGREGRSFLQHPDRVVGIREGDEIAIYQGIKHAYWVGDVGDRDPRAHGMKAPAGVT